jgi:hypothetical protein
MDPVKRRLIELIEADRVRMTRHFRDACREDQASFQDAVFAVRNGARQGEEPVHARGALRYRFHGVDTMGRRVAVVVELDEQSGQEVARFITLFTR